MSGTISTIPISADVNVIPGVLSGGGNQVQLNGLFLTEGTRVPIGSVYSFPSATSVLAYFGSGAVEYAASLVYFAGFTNCTQLPGAMLVTQYNNAAVPGWLRGGVVSGLTLTQLQAITGTLVITFAGSALTAAAVNLSSATSFSNAASIIQSAFTSPPFTVTYDAVWGSFVFTSTATGSAETIIFATGTTAASLLLTSATGATLSQGASAVSSQSAFMTSVVALTQNWACFTTLFNPDSSGNTLKLAFATWTGQQNNRYAYVPWDNDVNAETSSNTTNLGYLIQQAAISGTCLVWEPGTYYHATFVLGFAASINFSQTNGRFTLKFRDQSGLVPAVNNATTRANLISYGYNFLGVYANAANQFTYFAPGAISGTFLWFDSYINQIWLNAQLQQALITLLMTVGNIPYAQPGDDLVSAACQDPINAALNFGAIRPGVALSVLQQTELNNAAGRSIAQTVMTQGWYLLIGTATSQVRAARTSPPITLWYVDGESIQAISLASIEVQ